ncbi:efflux RND transporter periplasmic adaptor subunit [Candidatus Formimonas warabiya]|uniref:Efflux transporter periplasmic adaptor subunit n=1 Tax=Formimonas warabiya TaxID=1761012 RepID=A0A3G1KZ58_FORW1|nr:efflux RND transporter periplasmic adaptor subunit [Candidatus Formimonas warabiya]ATW27667.1 efflux transporter periplasmic adaptor subunit [Candidatus Formimonas warabiya]
MNFWRRIQFLLVLGLVVVCLSTLVVIRINSKTEKMVLPPPLVKTLHITAADKDSEYSYSGEVRSRYESILAFQVGGKIIKKNVEVGDTVKQGTVLMELDARDIEQAVKNSANLVSSAESKYKLAQDNLKRIEQLYQDQVITQADYDTYENSYETSKAALEQANALYTQSINQLGYCKLHADKSGVIGSIDAEEGQIVAAGQKIVTLVQNKELEVEINVPENRIVKVKKAKEITVGFWALPDVKIKGVLGEVSPLADTSSRTYKVRIGLVDPSPNIQLGMSSTVWINENDHSNERIWIPLGAVYQQGSSPAVWIVKENAVSLKNITIGDFSGDQVAVSTGLKEGDVIVTAGVNRLREGQDVRVGGEN